MARVNISRAAKILEVNSRAAPLVARTTSQISHFAKLMAPKGDHMSGSGRRRLGPHLHSTISSRVKVGAGSIVGTVGSRKKYAATVHQGSSAHYIRARGKLLKFKWERGNLLLEHRRHGRRQFFYFGSVRHPGNKRPVRYLTTPLSMIATRNGFLVFGVGRGRSRLP